MHCIVVSCTYLDDTDKFFSLFLSWCMWRDVCFILLLDNVVGLLFAFFSVNLWYPILGPKKNHIKCILFVRSYSRSVSRRFTSSSALGSNCRLFFTSIFSFIHPMRIYVIGMQHPFIHCLRWCHKMLQIKFYCQCGEMKCSREMFWCVRFLCTVRRDRDEILKSTFTEAFFRSNTNFVTLKKK